MGDPVNFKSSEPITARRAQEPNRRQLLGGPDARIVVNGDEAARIRLSHEQNVQVNSDRCLAVITEAPPRHAHTHAAKSSTAQAQCLRPVGPKSSRAGHRRRQTAPNLTTFVTGIRRFVKAYGILWQKLYARFSEHTFDQRKRVQGSSVATHLDIRDRVSMQTGRLSQIPNRPIERSTAMRICALVIGRKRH
jgi:hypothetical protein